MNTKERQDAIAEIHSLLGPNPWARPMRWDHLSDKEIQTQLHNARAYIASQRAGRTDSTSPGGVARMDSEDAEHYDDEDYDISGNPKPGVAARRAREQLGRPSRHRGGTTNHTDRAPAPASTDESAAKARMNANAQAQLGQPSLHRKVK
jgi:hypothetical protein